MGRDAEQRGVGVFCCCVVCGAKKNKSHRQGWVPPSHLHPFSLRSGVRCPSIVDIVPSPCQSDSQTHTGTTLPSSDGPPDKLDYVWHSPPICVRGRGGVCVRAHVCVWGVWGGGGPGGLRGWAARHSGTLAKLHSTEKNTILYWAFGSGNNVVPALNPQW
eukprot:TRINITY_DN9885_c0_g2_i1.p1 TRINITY_DN9885_c0_g2~~TRINITY_DN9885_c0_g2_i1.p1  ORF type:complete len:160 (-),score=3.60 TRINITY_DN9885_c0_g2_i1:120-599(-)